MSLVNVSVGGPRAAEWVAAVYSSESDDTPVGTGFLLDRSRVLTAAHVVAWNGATPSQVWVEFPKSASRARVLAHVMGPQGIEPDLDAAVLLLEAPMRGAVPARVRCVDPESLAGSRWWSYGFPHGDRVGAPAHGTIVGGLTRGWFGLESAERYGVERGFSGAPVWSDRYQAVVGLITQASMSGGTNAGDGRALSLHRVQQCLPHQELGALAYWRLADNPEAAAHWDARARGVGVATEEGYRFQGRRAALSKITSWIADSVSPKVLVVTGSPGAGKSAVLGRIVTSADPDRAQALDAVGDVGVRAQVGSIWCAVHAQGKTVLEISEEIARAVSMPLPGSAQELIEQIRSIAANPAYWGARGHALVIDAVDEAKTSDQARAILRDLAAPLAQRCADLGVRVLVGSRRGDAHGGLLDRLADAAVVLDLDAPAYFALKDLQDYALTSLQLRGRIRAGNPYLDLKLADPVASRIARLSAGNFLVAGLISRYHGLNDDHALDPARLSFPPTTADAFDLYLKAVSGCAGLSSAQLLTALAYVPRVSLGLWRTVLHGLYETSPGREELRVFVRGAAANFLIDALGEGDEREYSLFHQALTDALLNERDNLVPDHRSIARAMIAQGRASGWERAPDYLLRALARHAATGQILDELLADAGYLSHAEPRSLVPYLKDAHSQAARWTAAIYRTSVHLHENATPIQRQGVLALDAARAGVRNAPGTPSGRWVPKWATGNTFSPPLLDTLIGHASRVAAVACTVLDGHPVAVTGSQDQTVRVWDLRTGVELGVPMTGHTEGVATVACTVLDGIPVAVTGGWDGTVRVWDLRARTELGPPLTGHAEGVMAVACAVLDGTPIAVTGTDDRTVRVWDLRARTELGPPMIGHTSSVVAVACTVLDGIPVAVTGGWDGTVRLWDLRARTELGPPMTRHTNIVRSVACTVLDGHPVAVTGSQDQTVRVWDLRTGVELGVPMTGHTEGVATVACTVLDGIPVAVTGGWDGTVRVWDLRARTELGPPLTGHAEGVMAVACVALDGIPVAVTGGWDGTVRVWDLRARTEFGPPTTGYISSVRAVACAVLNRNPIAVAVHWDGTLRLWDLRIGAELRGRNVSVCPVLSLAFCLGRALICVV